MRTGVYLGNVYVFEGSYTVMFFVIVSALIGIYLCRVQCIVVKVCQRSGNEKSRVSDAKTRVLSTSLGVLQLLYG